jgi:DnaK suppressor protein
MRRDIDLSFFKRELEKRRAAILALADERKEAAGTVELDQSRLGRLSRMDALQQQAMARATRQRSAMELQRIESALARIRSGDYGYCAECGEEIAERRLRIDPSALICIVCAQAAEGR